MALHPRAGQPALPEDLTNIAQLVSAYFVNEVDPRQRAQQVQFGTSGHRGCSLQNSFNEAHILAISQALVAYREEQGITGPLLLGRDTHALSEAAYMTALEVFIGNGIEVHIQTDDGYTPTPVISHAILAYNKDRSEGLADGVVITPSHNPPTDGGFKYNPPHGGPAGSDATKVIEKYANALLSSDLLGVNAVSYAEARGSQLLRQVDWRAQYIAELEQVIDIEAIRKANLRIGVDAMGGAGASYWQLIAEHYNLEIDVYHAEVDPSFRFMSLDKDGKIRMDCSSPYAMATLLELKDNYAVAVGNDPDYDRHGIVCPKQGLLNPNHYLAIAIDYLCRHRGWSPQLAFGKTLVSSALIDRVVAQHERPLLEMPVGFKWFAPGLRDGTIAFAGEESAGATFVDRQGHPWSTDKDGIILALLAAEIVAVTGANLSDYYQQLCAEHGTSYYRRLDVASTPELNAAFAGIRGYKLKLNELAGDAVVEVMTKAPGNSALIGGVKVTTSNGWFAARPSGTEPIYKIYCESFVSDEHLTQLAEEAQTLVQQWLT
ncbi:phosphoglucomutase (alpha-D-glucose-1,6-bisphosphate-dependent) [Pseudidiomarina sp. 1APP75-32.1]|uniref:Phosphoglucomutase n=1 Tax=Pseudidiomarina terrestris TaxID=2820060 RepID=A0AAW7R0D8_9GAMM|nr:MULTISPECIES: phosphoglucomutase (alpha-D-glucose-1,6-bisphosphate-dependent) [unclassified Pseudidiomarina]MDN7124090.1 phosphoglucomutase (alpha-D-glucose-1,6-bisphosphate-dependent) [Pseudidiomarina sp. 1APP75-32.1]MDN7128347.1 phosphoglucomutase (alpha-D-glucose-1,6-bisphosphate-dependent) [Pseudidiomarina sp. 1APR75-15]